PKRWRGPVALRIVKIFGRPAEECVHLAFTHWLVQKRRIARSGDDQRVSHGGIAERGGGIAQYTQRRKQRKDLGIRSRGKITGRVMLEQYFALVRVIQHKAGEVLKRLFHTGQVPFDRPPRYGSTGRQKETGQEEGSVACHC